MDKDVEAIADKIILKKNIVILTGGAIDKTAFIPDTGFDISYHKKISGNRILEFRCNFLKKGGSRRDNFSRLIIIKKKKTIAGSSTIGTLRKYPRKDQMPSTTP